ncbi:MAG: O-antigen ligase family protein [Pseudomonadota bacterium]|nr:O-antigen ligase family protein [Pseudomonadota bacterium]
MNRDSLRSRIPVVNSALLAVLFFLVPTQIAPAYVLSAVMLGLWLVEGRLPDKWQSLRSNPVFWIFQAYFWWFVVSLAWTDDLAAGGGMVSRHLFFLLSAMYFTVARREHTSRYLVAFAAGVLLCELLAGYNWLQLNRFPHWPAGWRAAKDAMETAPFVDRIMFGPAIAFAGYIAAWQAIATRRARQPVAAAAWAFSWLATIVVLSFSGSRTGMAGLSLMMGLLTLQTLARHRAWAVVGAAAVLATTAFGLYAMSDAATRQRVVDGFAETHKLDSAVNMSVPLRYTMAVNTLHIIAEHPWLGVGAGDFVAAYKDMNARRTPAWNTPRNPHNQLLFTVATTGLVGGVLLLAVWFAPPWLNRRRQDGLGALRIGLPVFFFTICLAESYLWRTNTALMFALFSALLYGPLSARDTPTVTAPRSA